ncbi:hypothetical protein AALB47_06045 [Lachnospiraceae bacterium 54-11]
MKRGKKLAVWMAGAALAAGLLSGCQKQQEPKRTALWRKRRIKTG